MCLEADARHDNDNAAMAMELDMRLAIAAMRLVGWMTQLQPTTGVVVGSLAVSKIRGSLRHEGCWRRKGKRTTTKEWDDLGWQENRFV